MSVFTDMMGREVVIDFPPQRIISLVPSQTELLHDLGLRDEVIGITKFCVHPEEWFRSKTGVGGTKQLHINKIKELKPDLIIANKEENEQSQIEELAKNFPVWVSDIKTVFDALTMIKRVGELVNKKAQADTLSSQIAEGFNSLARAAKPKRVAYFIWYNPWMTVGGDTFISDMIDRVGWVNVFKDACRYPATDLASLQQYDPEFVLLSSEPFPFKEKHIAEVREVLPNADVRLVDGEMFSWYGSRMLKAIPYFKALVNE